MSEIDLDGLVRLILDRHHGARTIVAMAGGPGAGKSAAAGDLLDRPNEVMPGLAAPLPMDGFHLDDMPLDTRVAERRRRLEARRDGYDPPAGEMRRKVEENNLPNGQRVIAGSVPADVAPRK